MSKATITGILKDQLGNILSGATLLFQALRTSETVLNTTSASITTDANGTYSIDLEFGVYTLKIKTQNELNFRTIASNILVYRIRTI
jgi:hypothetical protein